MAKLFAKHFKVGEQQALLEASVVGIACGTPNRLCKLADLGALSLAHCRLILLDVHRDLKQRCCHGVPGTTLLQHPWRSACVQGYLGFTSQGAQHAYEIFRVLRTRQGVSMRSGSEHGRRPFSAGVGAQDHPGHP